MWKLSYLLITMMPLLVYASDQSQDVLSQSSSRQRQVMRLKPQKIPQEESKHETVLVIPEEAPASEIAQEYPEPSSESQEIIAELPIEETVPSLQENQIIFAESIEVTPPIIKWRNPQRPMARRN